LRRISIKYNHNNIYKSYFRTWVVSELIDIVAGGYKIVSNDEFIPSNKIMQHGTLRNFPGNNEFGFYVNFKKGELTGVENSQER